MCSAAVISVSMLVSASAFCMVITDDRPGLEIDGMLGPLWAMCVRPSFIFGDLRVGTCGWVQSSFRALLLLLPIEPSLIGTGRRLDPEAGASFVRKSW